jgi:hypothetical protein
MTRLRPLACTPVHCVCHPGGSVRPAYLAVPAVAVLLAVAGCGSSSGDPGPAVSASTAGTTAQQSAAPPVHLNPVTLIRQAGGDPEQGATVGSTDAQGNRYARGEIGPDQRGAREEIVVYVWTGTPWPPKPSDDSHWYIEGTGFEVELTGTVGDHGVEFTVPPEQVAAKLGGKVTPRG